MNSCNRFLVMIVAMALFAIGCTNPTSEDPMSVNEIPDNGMQFNGKSQPNTLSIGQTQPVNALQASFPRASTYTVQFSVTPAQDVPTNMPNPEATEAIVNWVLDGNNISRRITVGNGISISGTAQGVNVQLLDVSKGGTLTPPATGKYQVTVSVTPGVRANEPIPVCLYPFGNVNATAYGAFQLNANSTVLIPVPSDAGATSVQVLPSNISFPGVVTPGGGLIIVEFFIVSSDGLTGVLTGGFDPTLEEGFVPLPPTCNMVQIRTRGVASPINFQVAFGIDG
jgi:hypothetical protein